MRALHDPQPDRRRRARLGFVVHAGVLVAGSTATVGADAATWFGVRGPRCPVGACLGPLACPGCGLVRSVSASLHGDLAGAFAVHPAGPAIAVLAALGAATHFAVLCRRRPVVPGDRCRYDRLLGLGRRLFLASLVVGWLARAVLHAAFAP